MSDSDDDSTYQGRHFCFTYNREAKGVVLYEQLEDFTAAFMKLDQQFSSYCYQEETGCKDGKRHVQGYLSLRPKTKKRLPALKKMLTKAGLNKAIHLEKCRGRPDQNWAYCSKTSCTEKDGSACKSLNCQFSVLDGPVTKGEAEGGQGKRNDLLEIKEKIDTKGQEGLQQAWDENFGSMVRYHRGINTYLDVKGPKRLPQDKGNMKVLLFLGPAGTGKSYKAMQRWPGLYKKDQSKWWDGYCGQECVLFDDFVGAGDLQCSDLLSLLDGITERVQVKGGYKNMVAKTFVFTSNKPIEEW